MSENETRASGNEPFTAADILTITEAAQVLRVHPVTLRKKAVAWGVPHKRLGASWRFSRVTLLSWLGERDG